MKKIIYHIVLILLLLSIPVISSPDFDGTLSVFRSAPFQREFIRFILIVAFFYLNLMILLPKLFRRRKILEFTVCIAVSYAVVVFLPFFFVPNQQGNADHPPKEITMRIPPPSHRMSENPPPRAPGIHPNPEIMGAKKDNTLIKKVFTSILPFLFSFLSSLFIYRSNEQKEIERSKAKAELLNLKYQLQPHFLFNILNSIYSLALLKSDDAPNGILKLSNVMRYVVQESSKDLVELSKEIDYIKDYIALQLIRTDSSLDFSYSETGDPESSKIAPFLLINFVENAFKYGFNAEENSKISIEIIVQESTLHFKVFNNIVNKTAGDEYSLKIGLKNTEEHLNQMYPKKHILKINNNGNTFNVDLQINLS